MPAKPLRAIKPMFPSPSSWRIVRGDRVQVVTGRDRGTQGEVLRVIRDPRFPRVFVSGVNMITRHVPAMHSPSISQKGYRVKMEAPIHYSNVMLLDPNSNKPVRTHFVFEDQPPYRRLRKTRGRHATGAIIPWPEKWKQDPAPSTLVGDKDTRPEHVDEVTYDPANDFNMVLPSAHTRLREQREAAAASAAAKAQAQQLQQQRWRAARRLLFSPADSGGSEESSSGGSSRRSSGSSRGRGSARGYATAAGGSSHAVGRVSLSLLQRRLPLASCSSSISRLLCAAGRGSEAALSASWRGLAAAAC